MLALVLLNSAGTLFVTHDLNDDLKRAADITARKQYLAGDVRAATAELANYERGVVLSDMISDAARSEKYRQQFTDRAVSLRKTLAELRDIAGNQEALSLVEGLERQMAVALQGHQQLTQSMASQQMDAALVDFNTKIQPQLEEMGKAATTLVEEQGARVSHCRSRIRQ